MKKKSAFHSVRRNFRQGGFFKLRVLFGVLLCFAGVTIVLLALGKASAQPRTPAGPNDSAKGRTRCGEQDRAVGNGTHR